MKTAIIGSGAIGIYYGAMLANNGCEVHFLLRSDYQHVKLRGLEVISNNGDIRLKKVNAWNDPADIPQCELVIITLKTTANHLLKKLLPPSSTAKTKFLVLQNGLGVEEDIANATLPKAIILSGLCTIGCNKTGLGKVKHIAYNNINMGHYKCDGNPGMTPELIEVAAVFEKAGIPVEKNEDIREIRWKKLVWNMAFNGLTTILDCDTSKVVSSPGLRQRAFNIMCEVIKTANSTGLSLENGLASHMLEITDNMQPYLPSMKLDFDAGREMELETIYRRPLDTAHNNSVEVPELEKIYCELKELSNK